jgi:hypothetical protein
MHEMSKGVRQAGLGGNQVLAQTVLEDRKFFSIFEPFYKL